jgi:hypothetical protein
VGFQLPWLHKPILYNKYPPVCLCV